MEKRFLLALLLTGAVLVLTPMLSPPRPPMTPVVDTAATHAQPASDGAAPSNPRAVPAVATSAIRGVDGTTRTMTVDTATLAGEQSTYAFVSSGAAPIGVTLPAYHSLAPGGTGTPVRLTSTGSELLQYRILSGADTILLNQIAFRAVHPAGSGPDDLRFESAGNAPRISVEYRVTEPFVTRVRITTDISGPAYLLANLPTGLASQEADTLDDIRHLAISTKPVGHSARGITFSSLDPGEQKLVAGPISWAVTKSKYFVVGMLSANDSTPFAEVQVTGGPRTGKLATRATGVVVVPLVNGAASFSIYAGPQSWERMRAIGREFETANPYGGFMQPVVQPFATIVMRIMLWMKRVVMLDYGWVLVIFGLAIRLVLWPLNQSAMRSSIRVQRIQPEISAVQARYKNDREKMQQEIMRVYQEHGMSPFSALSGCLPALIPMPVFFALFFVFQNTIEFRGVPFLWLSDISLHDPLYVLPLLTGASMFLLSWIGMRNMPKNPQSTMMLYLMPGMFTMFLLNTASGLSIYYLVQQIAAIPQQWMIANERRKAQAAR